MKTAEKIIAHLGDVSEKGEQFSDSVSVDHIRAIQLDAFRAGMLRAAEISRWKHSAQASGAFYQAKHIHEDILTAANNLKPEDLK